ncbi:MAG: hypothetical protein Q9201_002237 [Fulgogasparrea decipioides]
MFSEDHTKQDQWGASVASAYEAPTRVDRNIGNSIDLNTTLLGSLLSFSKDGETLNLEDMAAQHHLRHNQSRAQSKSWQFGISDEICALAQYTSLVGVLGCNGKQALQTVHVDDVARFYPDEDLPDAYERRELPYYAIEAIQLIDRMTHHLGFQIVDRPHQVIKTVEISSHSMLCMKKGQSASTKKARVSHLECHCDYGIGSVNAIGEEIIPV